MAKGSKLIINIMANVADVKEKSKEVEATFAGLERSLETQTVSSDTRMHKLGKSLENIGGKIAHVGTVATTKMSIPIAGALGVATYHAVEFEDSFAGVRKTVEATEEQFQFLNKRIREMSTEIPASANELAEVMEIAGQLGIATKDLEKFTEVAVNMGVATNLSSEEAATSLARFANIMGTIPEEYENIGSAVVDLGNKNATTEREIMNMSLRLASAGKIAGLTEPEILGISTALTSVGISAEAGGTAFSKLISAIHVAGTVGVDQMKDLEEATGMTHEELYLMATNSPKQFRELADAMGLPAPEMRKIVDAGWELDKMSQIAGVSMEEFATVIEEGPAEALEMFLMGLFETEKHGKDAIAWLNEMNINETRLRDTIQRAGGARELYNNAMQTANTAYRENVALQEEAEEKYQTAASQLEMMKNAFINLAIEFGNRMLPYMKEMTAWLTELGNKIANMPEEQIDAIVKAAVTLAKTGPKLAITGKAIGGIGKALQMLSIPKRFIKEVSQLRGFYKGIDKIVRSKGLDPNDFIGDAYKDGGWSLTEMAHLSKSTPIDIYKDKTIAAMNAQSGQIKRAKQSLDEYKKSLQEAGKLQPGYSKSVMKTTDALNKMSASKVFQGGLWTTLILHIRNTVKNSETFRRGLKRIGEESIILVPLMEALGELIKSLGRVLGSVVKSIAGFVKGIFDADKATSDFLFVIAGVVSAITGVAPVAGTAMAAISAFTGVVKLLGKETDAQANANAIWEESTRRVEGALTDLKDPMEHITNEYMPQIVEKIRGISDLREELIDDNGKAVKMTEEQYNKMTENLEGFLEISKEYITKYHDESQENMKNYYENLDTDGREFGKKMVKMSELNKETRIKQVERMTNRIMVLNKKERTHKEGLTEAEKAERDQLYKDLDAIDENRRIQLEKRLEAEKMYLVSKLKETGDLTEAEEKRLTEIQQEEYDQRYEDMVNAFSASYIEMTEFHGDSYEESEKFHRDIKELTDKHIEMDAKAQAQHFKDLIKESTGFTLEALKDHEYRYRIAKGYREAQRGEQGEYFKFYEEALLNAGKDEEDALHESIEEWDKHSDEFEKNMRVMEGVIKTLPDHVKDSLTTAEGEFKMDFVYEVIGETSKKAKREAYAAGQDTGRGLSSGALSQRNSLIRTGWQLGSWMINAVKNKLGIKSPSRVMMELGGDTTDGLEKGLLAGKRDIERASAELAEASLVDDLQSFSGMSASINRQVNTTFSTDYVTSLSNSIARAVAREMANAPITAVIGEDEFGEGVEEAMAYSMWRNG